MGRLALGWRAGKSFCGRAHPVNTWEGAPGPEAERTCDEEWLGGAAKKPHKGDREVWVMV